MSVEATSWALQQQAVTDPAARAVLFGLANHANHEGRHAFPSVDLLCRYTGLGRRTVIAKLKLLQEQGLIRKGNQKVAAAIIDRADRRPVVYDLALGVGLEQEEIGDEQTPADLFEPGASAAPRDNERGANAAPRSGNGVQMTAPRGARAAPEPSLTVTPPPSDARDVFDRAAEQDDQGQPRDEFEARVAEARRQFPMTYGWQPEPEALAAACWRRGLPSNVTPTPATLADFTAHFAEKPDQRLTHQGWHERLAKWLDENRRKAMTTGGTDDRTADRPRHERAEREAVRQQLANPWDTSWADGLWPDDEPDAGAQGGDPGAGSSGIHSAGVDLPEDVFERVPECGPAQAEPPRAGGGAGAVAEPADGGSAGAGHERAEAVGEYLAADDPGAGADAGAHPGGFRHADDW